jgi:hypothetical protein
MKVPSASVSFLKGNKMDMGLRDESSNVSSDEPLGEDIKVDIEEEVRRLQSLRSFHLLDDDPQDCYRRFASLAAQYFHAPLSNLVLVDMERCWSLASSSGNVNNDTASYENRETPRWNSIYNVALEDPAMFYCTGDLESDVCSHRMRNISKIADYRFFVSTPLVTSNGDRIGVLSVMDFEARPAPTVEDVLCLKDLAAFAVQLMEQRRSLLMEGVNHTSVGLLRSARFVRDCLEGLQQDYELQTLLGESQKEYIDEARSCTDIVCRALSSPSMGSLHNQQDSNKKLVKENLCNAHSSSGARRKGFC